ncbi:MAG: response regulator [Bdellovibrionaceae bacterium]|nr:response regulator [Pseudobdellovibrionaceae bacterium]
MFNLKTRILVVDDMATMRKIIVRSLKQYGFEDIVEKPDGDVAWAAIQESVPPVGLVISDWNMPNCSGLDLLKRVRADGRFKTLPFLLVTAECEAKQVAQASMAKVDGYIVKPFSPETLQAKILDIYNKTLAKAG